jgi:hypothetical protein
MLTAAMNFLRISAALLLAGCAAAPTPAEQANFAEYQRIAQELYDANADLCGHEVCRPPLQLVSPRAAKAAALAYGTTLDPRRTIYIRQEALKIGMSDAEAAQMLGHELAHLFLGHQAVRTRASVAQEDDADCVGTIFAVRAGYVPGGVPQYLAVKLTEHHLWEARPVGFSSYANGDAIIAVAAQDAVALKKAGKPIDRAAIKDICGVAPK